MINLRSLVAKLNSVCRECLEAALGLAASRGHYNVELEHWLLKVLERADSDAVALVHHYQADQSRLVADLNRVLNGFKSGNSRTPALADGPRC